MTQPYAPLQGLPGFGGGQGATTPLTGLPGFAPQPAPLVPGSGGAPPLPAALRGTSLAAFDAARPASDVGALETAATQTGRGILDALLESGAILGAATEGIGSLGGWKGIEDFGRDLGQQSSGNSAMQAAAYLFGGGGQKGLSYAERTDNAIREQEQAWPLLSTVSRIGGGVAFGLATGGLSGASGGIGATRAGTIGIGATAGAGGGIQDAYYKNQSLRDVLVAGATGAAFGGASGWAIHGAASKLSETFENRGVMRQVFGDIKTAADDVAEEVRKAGGKELYEASKVVLKERARILAEVAKAGDNPNVIRETYNNLMHSAGQKLSDLAGEFDAGTWAKKAPTPLQKLLHRTPLLDRVATDLADDAAKMRAARPSLDFELNVPKKLLADADKVGAITGLQIRTTRALEEAPPSGLIRSILKPGSDKLAKANAPEAMAAGHNMVRQLNAAAASGELDEISSAFALRQARNIADELGGDNWGAAGKAYRALTRPDSQLDNLLDNKAMREALKHADSSKAIPGAFTEENAQLITSYAARKELGGAYVDGTTRNALADIVERTEKAHTAVTFDGAPARRVLEILSGAGRNIGESYASDILGMGIGAAIGGVPGMLVARALSPVLGDVAAAAFGKGVAKAGEKAGRNFARVAVKETSRGIRDFAKGSLTWQQYNYNESIERLIEAVTRNPAESASLQKRAEAVPPDSIADAAAVVQSATQGQQPDVQAGRARAIHALPVEIQVPAATDMQGKLETLLNDMPKPQPNIRGKAFETLSRGDLGKAQAMWEATMEPMSVFSEFVSGRVNYDKVQYAWKQYPGLKLAAQAGLMDIINTQLDDKGRAGISDGMLTQLDNLFGFDGALQPTLDRGFANRMSALGQSVRDEQQQPPRGGKLQQPGAKPTFTERIAGS